MKVSVIIPVYNAEKYVTEAVESALMQPETGEVLLIEDKSPDNSLAVCQQLASKYDKVKLFQHPDQGNHGAGATRNVGLLNAKFPYICFLDADDYMLANRFKAAVNTFEQYPDAEGVYDAIGIDFDNEAAKTKWFETRNFSTTTIHKIIPPEEVFYCQTVGRHGYFHTDGIVLKKGVFDKVGLFDTELKLSQDNHMFVRISALCKLYPGEIERPVANRRVHDENRILNNIDKVNYYHKLLWQKLFFWCVDRNIKDEYKLLITRQYYKHYISNDGLRLLFLINHIAFKIVWKFYYLRIKIRLNKVIRPSIL